MSDVSHAPGIHADAAGWAGHPRGLSTLFCTEMWERFSYYGMRAFLILYMVHALRFDDKHAGAVYGTYTGSVWFAAIFGGIIADRWLGQYRSVLLGGIIIALGHFTLAFKALPLFYTGLSLIVIGTALLKPASAGAADPAPRGFTAAEWKRIAAVVVFFLAASLFWAAYEQAGSTLNLFGDRYTRTEVLGFSFPSSWFVSVQAGFVILLAPVFAWLWVWLGPREPSSPAKFAIALLFAALAFLLLVPAGVLAHGGVEGSPRWRVGAYFIEELGELSLSPVGLSVVTKLAPTRIVGLMMGVWFLSNALGNKLAGWAAGFISTLPLPTLFGAVAGVCLAAALVMFLLIKPVRNLMGGVH